MRNFINVIKKHYQQFFFVFAAFFSVTIISYYYVSEIAERNLNEQSARVIAEAEAELKTVMGASEAILNGTAHSVLNLLAQGKSANDIASYLEDVGLYTAKNLLYYDGFGGVYGVIDGGFISATGYIPPDDYDITLKPWYTAVTTDTIAFSPPYYDEKTGDIVISASKRVTDAAGNDYGVLAIDIKAATVDGIINNMCVCQDGYGVLADNTGNIISHKNALLIGYGLSTISDRADLPVVQQLVNDVAEGTPVLGARFADYAHVKSSAFFSKIFNGWSIGVIIPMDVYYGETRDMTFVTAMMSFMLALIIGYFITLLTFEKMRSDEENQNKSSFLAKMSHELRTPLNAVLGMSELILREDIPHNIYENALSIKQASSNLLSIINDILDYSKIESGKLEIVPVNYYFSSMINDVISIIRMRLTDKPIKLAVNVDCMIPNRVYGDEVRIRQVLINLLSNAVKYTKEGSIAVNIYGEVKDADTFEFTIEIADTGIGIKDEDIHKLFGDFVQINMAANKGVEGTGLGLVIARNICRAMGGDITVKSVYGEGSTFTVKLTQMFRAYEKFAYVEDAMSKQVLLYETRAIYAKSVSMTLKNLGVTYSMVQNQSLFYEELKNFSFPFIFVSSFLFSSAKNILDKLEIDAKLVLISEYGEVITAKCDRIIEMPAYCITIANVLNNVIESNYSHEADTGIRFCAPTARVLIVDDIATNLKVAEGLMAPYNMKVDTAKSGMEAIERVKKTNYDLVFMDHMMPGMDGIEATERIRKLDGEADYYKNIPIIALTAVAISGVKEMFLQNGLNDFLAKPIEMAKLNLILDKWIPKEKQEKITKAQDAATGVTIEIDGIDTKVGLSMTGGSYDAYIRVLEIFHKDCLEKMEEITQALQNNDLYLYTTYVHALKSASANVGALKMSEFAKSLEGAGKNEDVMYITENNDEFFQTVRLLLRSISAVIDKANEENPTDAPEGDTEQLKASLTTLKTALDDMDIGIIDNIVTELQAVKWTGSVRDGVEGIFHAILMFEYGDAIDRIDKILNT